MSSNQNDNSNMIRIEDTHGLLRTPGIVKCNNPLKLNPFGLV